MFSLSPIKILVIVGVVLVLLGPDKLPEVAHKLGSSWRALKRLQERVESEVREAIPDLPSAGDLARIARSPVNLLNTLADRVDAREEAAAGTRSPDDRSEPRAAAIPDTDVAPEPTGETALINPRRPAPSRSVPDPDPPRADPSLN